MGEKNFMIRILRIPRTIVYYLILLYQKIFSPDHSFWGKRVNPYGYCKYYPTCSEYGKKVILKSGVIVGSLLAGWRILRCNPWSKGGIDEPQ